MAEAVAGMTHRPVVTPVLLVAAYHGNEFHILCKLTALHLVNDDWVVSVSSLVMSSVVTVMDFSFSVGFSSVLVEEPRFRLRFCRNVLCTSSTIDTFECWNSSPTKLTESQYPLNSWSISRFLLRWKPWFSVSVSQFGCLWSISGYQTHSYIRCLHMVHISHSVIFCVIQFGMWNLMNYNGHLYYAVNKFQ